MERETNSKESETLNLILNSPTPNLTRLEFRLIAQPTLVDAF